MGEQGNSPSSSIDSSSDPSLSTESSSSQAAKGGLSTDLRLGLSTSATQNTSFNLSLSANREHLPDWPPIKPLLRSAMAEREAHRSHKKAGTLFVKVYKEGIPIGRKLDLFAHDSYQSLIKTLRRMFRTKIICMNITLTSLQHKLNQNILLYAILYVVHGLIGYIYSDPLLPLFGRWGAGPELAQVPSSKAHVLTYEDKEGDWMMVGDVPWKLFLTTVKKLKIARAGKC